MTEDTDDWARYGNLDDLDRFLLQDSGNRYRSPEDLPKPEPGTFREQMTEAVWELCGTVYETDEPMSREQITGYLARLLPDAAGMPPWMEPYGAWVTSGPIKGAVIANHEGVTEPLYRMKPQP
jgi:hypothetical protein